ncbi:hypothetical protein D9M69_557510 [compost metagenome]
MPGTPASAKVGTSGSAGSRWRDATASARRAPAWTCAREPVSSIMSTWPAIRSETAGPLPLYGMCSTSTPVRCLNIEPARCCDEPTPPEP